MTYLQGLVDAIAKTHGVEARHIETVPIREMWEGKVAWEGNVEVFAVEHPSASRCYGWGYPIDGDPSRRQYVCVLGAGPVDSPLNAVRAAVRAQASNDKKSTKGDV